MKVRLVYRHYKPLHAIHQSLVQNPPAGVEYVVPNPNRHLQKLFFLHRYFREFPPVKWLVKVAEKTIFANKGSDSSLDLYHYVNMIDRNPPDKPYVVDVEHVAGLSNFTPDPARHPAILAFLENPNCRAIICFSQAAKRSLKRYFSAAEFKRLEPKVQVIYPAVKPQVKAAKKTSSGPLKLLFVGNQAYLKGLEELLAAIKTLNESGYKLKIKLQVISDDGLALVKRYDLPNAQSFPAKFSKTEILDRFFKPSDLLVIPTKEDTYGMAFLDALSAGTPVVATDQFAIPELVENGKDGMLIHLENPLLEQVVIPSGKDMEMVTKPNFDERLHNELVTAIKHFADNRQLLPKLAKQGLKKFQPGGRFAINTRNRALEKIYHQALKPYNPRHA